jgi:hypothetical protein
MQRTFKEVSYPDATQEVADYFHERYGLNRAWFEYITVNEGDVESVCPGACSCLWGNAIAIGTEDRPNCVVTCEVYHELGHRGFLGAEKDYDYEHAHTEYWNEWIYTRCL